MITRLALIVAVVVVDTCDIEPPGPANFDVVARGETAPSPGDLDDVAIWVHPGNPSGSLIVATDKSGGIMLYELDGTLRQDRRDGVMNNVDLRNNVDLGLQWGVGVLIAASNRTDDTIDLYTIDLGARLLEPLAAIPSDIGEPYGVCTYRSPIDRLVHVLIADQSGELAQYELSNSGSKPTLLFRRAVTLGDRLEGCVADDELARIYVGDEDVGIWRLGAEPNDDGEAGLLHEVADEDAHLTADVEGLTIYYAAGGAGYLIASSQGTGTYVIYERGGNNAYVTHFRIVAGGLDAASDCDGIDVTNLALGSLWPNGLFVAQDDRNENLTRNFKLVDWGDVVAAADVTLLLDTDFSRD